MAMGHKLLGVFGTIVIVTSLAACTGAAGGADVVSETSAPETHAANVTTGMRETPVSPIDEYLNLLWGTNLSPTEQISRHAAETMRIEELVAQCMNGQGFEYIPDPGRRWLDFDSGIEWRTDDPEWIEQHGFGGTVWPGVRAGTAMGWEGDRPGRPGPNAAYFNSLSESERTAFNTALNGIFPPDDSNYDFDEWRADPNNQGCRDAAWLQMREESPAGLPQTVEFAPLFEAIDFFRENLELTATQADQDWAACMAAADFVGYEQRPDFQELFRKEVWQITQELQEQGRPIRSFPELPANAPEIAALFDREVETALADLNCRNATDWDARQQATIFELEAQFIADHQAQFNALRAAVEQLS